MVIYCSQTNKTTNLNLISIINLTQRTYFYSPVTGCHEYFTIHYVQRQITSPGLALDLRVDCAVTIVNPDYVVQ